MMNYVDARTSQNASTANSIAIPILFINTPQLFGQIGLLSEGVTTNLRLLLKGTISVQLPLALVGVTVTIVRGTLTYTAFVSSNLPGTIRVGPESFDGILVFD